jgi:hypothetical protein
MLNLNSSEKIIWEGEDIPCLFVCKGDEINGILQKLCILYKEQQDLINSISKLNFSCFGNCNIDLNKITIKSIIQYLLDNDKAIQTLIETNRDILDNTEIYLTNLDLKCLLDQYVIDNGGDKCNLDLDVSKTIQLIIDNSCKSVLSETPSLLDKVNTLKEEVDLIITNYALYEEPIINSVLSNVYRVSSHIENISDNAVFNLKNLVGTYTKPFCNKVNYLTFLENPLTRDINPASHLCNIDSLKFNGNFYPINKDALVLTNIYQLVKILNDTLYYNNIKGFFYSRNNLIIYQGVVPSVLEIVATYCGTSPSISKLLTFNSVVENSNNQLYNIQKYQSNIICSLENRLSYIEATCCRVSCKDIKIGFTEIFDADQETYVLYFNKNSGNSIPEEYTDNGSTITLTDHTGRELTYDISIEQQFEFILDLSGLDTSQNIIININGVFENELSNCSVCYNKVVEAISSPCTVCKICASGDEEAAVTLKYTTASNTNTQTSVLYNGQCLTFKLPEDNPTFYTINRSSDEIELVADETQCSLEILKAIQSIKSDGCWFFPLPYPSFTGNDPGSGVAEVTISGPFYYYNKLYTEGSEEILSGCVHLGKTNSFPNGGCLGDLFRASVDGYDPYPASDFAVKVFPNEIFSNSILIKSKKYCGQLLVRAKGLGSNSDIAIEITDYIADNQQFGVILKLVGQSTINPPVLEILQKGTNEGESYGFFDLQGKSFPIQIKGQLVETCGCPSL